MLMLGLSLLWILLVWICHGLFRQTLTDINGRDAKRMSILENRLHQNFIFKDKGRIQKLSRWLLILGAAGSIVFFSWFPLLLSIILYLAFPWIWVRSVEYSRRKKFQNQLLQLIPLLSSMLRTGHSLEKSFVEVKKTIGAPMSEEIQFMLNEMKLGSTLETSLAKLVDRFHSENILTLSQAIRISRKLGTSLTEAMDHISQSILQKEKLKQQIHSLTSQGRMQAYVAVCMPFLIGLTLQVVSPSYFKPLLTTTIGHLAIAYGILSMSIGLFWIHRIVSKEHL